MAKYTVSNYPRDNLTAKTRSLLDALAANPATANIGVNSGYRSPSRNKRAGGASKSQHIHGNAVDLDVSGLSPSQKKEVLDTAVAAGARGIGIYPSGNSLHIDPRGTPQVWGPSPRGQYRGLRGAEWRLIPDWAKETVNTVFNKPTPPETMQAPLSLAQTQLRDEAIRTAFASPTRALDVLQPPSIAFSQPSRPQTLNPPSRFPGVPVGAVSRAPLAAIPASLTPAPVGRVTRAPLSPVVPGPQIAARPAFPGSLPAARPQSNFLSRPAPPATSLPAARPRSLAHPVSVAKPSNLPAAPVGQVTKGPALAPAGPNASTLAAQYAQYQPSKATSMPTVAGMPSIPAPTGLPAAPAQPLAHPVSVPAVQTPPAQVLAPALVPNYARPAPAPSSLPAARPAATAYDVYSGLATQAKDNTGQNIVGMLPDGTTTVTNKWGVTTGMTPYGKQTAVGNLPGITGPIAKTAAKVGIPAIGSMALGPIGGILGALAVGAMSKPGGLLGGPGLRTVDTMFGPIQAYQANRSLNSFPSAPSGGIRSATFSNRSPEGMRGISPKAAADISAGRGGLF